MTKEKTVRAWILYDWANSVFATTLMATVLPIFYVDVAGAHLPGNMATSYWGYTTTIAMLLVAVMAPILGAVADRAGKRKSLFTVFVFLGVLGSGLLVLGGEGDYLLISAVYILASIGFAGGNIFYDSFLPLIVKDDRIDMVSSQGYAMGYLGGGILLAVNLAMIMKPGWFGFSDTLVATRAVFLTVALWWLVFTIPACRHFPKDEGRATSREITTYVRMGFRELRTTLAHIRRYGELWKFLLAFWFYNDGIGTIMRMATVYGREIGIGQTDLIGALLLTQFIGIPFSILFGKLGGRIGAKRGIFLALSVYLLITIRGYFLATAFDFWMLAGLVGLVQGGAQALSRSLYGSMIPKDKVGEFYGFYGVSSKFSAITGPFLFALVGQLTGSSRLGIVSVAFFFIVGMFLLSTVDVEAGRALAKKEPIPAEGDQ